MLHDKLTASSTVNVSYMELAVFRVIEGEVSIRHEGFFGELKAPFALFIETPSGVHALVSSRGNKRLAKTPEALILSLQRPLSHVTLVGNKNTFVLSPADEVQVVPIRKSQGSIASWTIKSIGVDEAGKDVAISLVRSTGNTVHRRTLVACVRLLAKEYNDTFSAFILHGNS